MKSNQELIADRLKEVLHPLYESGAHIDIDQVFADIADCFNVTYSTVRAIYCATNPNIIKGA